MNVLMHINGVTHRFTIFQYFTSFFLFQSYFKTSSSGERVEWNSTVAGRPIHYSIVDLGGEYGHFIQKGLGDALFETFEGLLKAKPLFC